MVNLGQKVQFIPMEGIRIFGCADMRHPVIGKVVYINKPHRWFEVAYGDNDSCRTSFNFCDIGEKVHLL